MDQTDKFYWSGKHGVLYLFKSYFWMGLSLLKYAGASVNDKLKLPDTRFLSARVLKAPEKVL